MKQRQGIEKNAVMVRYRETVKKNRIGCQPAVATHALSSCPATNLDNYAGGLL